MSLVLTVDEVVWNDHVDRALALAGRDALIPVVKGNGYGFGRAWLAGHSVKLGATTIAVGTVHELTGTAGLGAAVVVLTPSLDGDLGNLPDGTVLTVGSPAQAAHLVDQGCTAPVVVKLQSSMLRHGLTAGELSDPEVRSLLDHLDVVAYAIHPPLAGHDVEHVAEIEQWLPHLDADAGRSVDVSHISVEAFTALRDRHPDRRFRLRLGTALWHGDKSMLHLGADVLDVRPVLRGTRAGYRAVPAPSDGHIVLIGAGTANGITLLDGGVSPFHHARRRLTLLESPHMHTSMAFVPAGEPLPDVGRVVDVQRPLTMVSADRVAWIR